MNIFSTDVNTCSTDKKFKKVPEYLNKTQVSEKNLVNSQSEFKFLCLTHKFYNFSIKIFFRICKVRKKS